MKLDKDKLIEIYTFCDNLNICSEFNDLLNSIARQIQKVLNVESVMIPILEEDKLSYTYAAAFGEFGEEVKGMNLPIDIGHCGKVIKTGKPIISNITSENIDTELSYNNLETTSQNFVLMPLIAREGVVGGIYLLNKDKGLAFSEEDIEYLEIFSKKVALLIENQQLILRIQRERESAFQNEKLVSIGIMSGGVAHEINNPLAVASGHIQSLLKGKFYREEELREKYKKIDNSLDRIKKIVASLLEFSHKDEEDNKTECMIEECVNIITAMAFEKCRSLGIEIKIQSLHAEKVLINKTQITQIILNLINNAIDSILEFKKNDENNFIEIKTELTKDHLLVNVSDSGPGIKKESQDRIFDQFYTTKPVGKGTGLGLSLSKQMAQKNNGDLRLLSDQKLTTFQLTLPLVK